MKLIIALLFAIGCTSLVAAKTNKIFCYYGSWAVYRRDSGKVSIEDINPQLCSHIIYSFVGLKNDGSVQLLDSWNDPTALTKLQNLKQQNPNVKLMAAIGGWNEGSTKYSTVVNSPTYRTKLVNSIVAFVLQYNLDGFDLDWEYPGQRGGAATDRAAFVQLLKELRPKFDTNGLILTAAVGASKHLHSTSYDVPELSKYLDFINIMSYDFHGSWESTTGQCSPLYASSMDADQGLSVDGAIKNWINAGAAPEKIILGIALYGRSFTLASPDNNGIGAPATGPGSAGPYSAEAGMLMYQEICLQQKKGAWTTVWDEVQKNPFAYSGKQWVGYDNAKSVALKAEYAVEQQLGGVMIWSIESDDVKDVCGEGKYPLLKSIGNVIDISAPAILTTPQPVEEETEEPQTTTEQSNEGENSGGNENTEGEDIPELTDPNGENSENEIHDPSGGNEPLPEEPTTTTTQPPVTSKPVDPPKFVCSGFGFFPDPASCKTFYVCVNVKNQLTPLRMKCPNKMHYDLSFNGCSIHAPKCD